MKSDLIGLLDCNNFFVSCERLFRPDLIDRPVVVLSGNDGCVVARSKEIKDKGIPMGVPYFQIKDKLKEVEAVSFSSHLALYRDISRRVFSVMREELEYIEQYSIDEAFFMVTDDPEIISQRLKSAVERRVGIPVSIGIARTKTQAKFANTVAKKTSGIYVLDEASWLKYAKEVSLAQVWGVGRETELKFKKHGLNNIADLISESRSRVSNIFGINGLRLQDELRGNKVFSVESRREPQKSILSSRSFKVTTNNKQVLADAVTYHVRQTAEDLRAMNMKAASIRLSIRPDRFGDFLLRGGSKEVILDSSTNSTLVLINRAIELLDDLYEVDVPYKKVGVTLSRFMTNEQTQPSLFLETKVSNSDGLMKVIDSINSKGKRDLVLIGSRLKGLDWQPRSDNRSPSYTTKWDEIRTVKS